MRFGIISDVHGNLVALRAAIAALDQVGYDQMICLGDVVGYGPDPAECLDLIDDRDAITVAGNHEEALCRPAIASGFNEIAREAINWTRNHLITARPELMGRVSRLPGMAYFGDRVMCVHDSPAPGGCGYLFDGHSAAHAFSGVDAKICLVGHTHVPVCFRGPAGHGNKAHSSQVETIRPRENGITKLDAQSRWIINPGSVGQPRDGDVRASLALLDLASSTLSWLRVPYDISEAQSRACAAGLPSASARRLSLGA
ncbi:MAG: metallophosphatase family protein [Phycisphaerales bacterium]|nr:metallophosphatase family protein [Phycisphaerales bacterium]